jgi:AbrB family looped-hinge helix DNA binding protein
MPTATMSSKGQTVIPKAMRERLGLRPGDALDFVVQDDGDVVIRPALEGRITPWKKPMRKPKGRVSPPRRRLIPPVYRRSDVRYGVPDPRHAHRGVWACHAVQPRR